MDAEAKIWQLARTLVGRHSTGATQVAHERAQQSLEQRDYSAAALWCQVAKVTHEITVEGALRRRMPRQVKETGG